jgi:DNA mismatch repair protein MutS2
VEATKTDLVEEARRELQDQIGDLLSRLRRVERSLRRQQEYLPLRPSSTEIPDKIAEPAPDEGFPSDAESPEEEPIDDLRAELLEARRQVTSAQWQPIRVQRSDWQQQLRGGDRVYLRGIGRPVEVINPPDADGQLEVLLGTMRAKIPVYQLERLAEDRPPAIAPPTVGRSVGIGSGVYLSRGTGGADAGSRPRPTSNEIDLRGHRVDEALFKIDGLLNDASLSGAGQVRIIHGRGTGALRRAIRDYLGEHPLVDTYAPAADASGEGVTVVDLK